MKNLSGGSRGYGLAENLLPTQCLKPKVKENGLSFVSRRSNCCWYVSLVRFVSSFTVSKIFWMLEQFLIESGFLWRIIPEQGPKYSETHLNWLIDVPKVAFWSNPEAESGVSGAAGRLLPRPDETQGFLPCFFYMQYRKRLKGPNLKIFVAEFFLHSPSLYG
jgi:hypothetical protein